MQNQLRILYESEGYRMASLNTDGEGAQVTLLWDERCRPRCGQCGQAMRINRKTRQSALDLALGPVTFVGILYEAVQGYCRPCGRYETVRPLGIVEQHMATLRLMRQVSLLCRWLPVARVCEVVAVTPASAYRYDRYILQTELPAPQLDGLDALLIDEKHLGRAGFVTLVLNARTGELLWLAEGRGKDALQGFFAKLTPEQKAGIAAVGIDRSGAYRAAVEAHLPAADIVFDKFHLISNLGEVIDKVRRRTQAQADAEGRTFLKGQRYNLLRNPENVSADGRRQLDTLLAANRDLSVVYLLKDAFKAVWTYTYRRSADKCLTHWIAMALESGVGELTRFARGLHEAKEQILNFCQHRITSARIEAFNTIVSRVIHKACGVANLDFLFLKLRQESLQR
ncbi:MAG: ISL3 family transposase [Nitrosomonadaceae bacterium]|nr:ISL3 family transposase [Mycobacteriaceae bacterium]NBQ69612.1 ISL3 family transposase [Nitrosomonadaceae bacterium]